METRRDDLSMLIQAKVYVYINELIDWKIQKDTQIVHYS